MLIALVIIGIIAALTIPNLLQKYQEQTTVKKVQKFYSNLSNAYQLAMKENGPANEWERTDNYSENTYNVYNILFKPYFKITKNCGIENTGNCIINQDYKRLNNSNLYNLGKNNSSFYKILLDDGAAIAFSQFNPMINVNYDTNGVKGPNQHGKDLFYFMIRDDKVYPVGIPSGKYSYASYSFNSTCNMTSNGTGYGCAAWIIYKGNMDYLHCDGLTWKSRSCKEK